ncbi:glycerol-3-phosphate regulon repressor [Cutibacterium acnes JCM 18920]|nr:glycerol-3-phosphate regulon repressor [Cutibacterium acnes JCM 18920]
MGPAAVRMIRSMHADLCFLSRRGSSRQVAITHTRRSSR